MSPDVVILAEGGYLNGQLPQVLYAINMRQDVQRFEQTVNSTYQPLSWLTTTGVFGLDYTDRYDHEVIPPNIVTFGSLPQGQVASNPYGIYDYTANGTLSALGRLVSEQLAYADRLFVTGTVRADQNSAFGQNFGSITYPALSVSWVVNEQSWFPSS